MVMTFGSAISALTLLLCAWSPSTAVFALAIALLEVASGMVLYQAAFAALVESRPQAASRSITYLTLIAGILMTGMAFWVSGQFFVVRAYTLLIFAGIWAMTTGIIDIVRAFQIREAGQELGRHPRR